MLWDHWYFKAIQYSCSTFICWQMLSGAGVQYQSWESPLSLARKVNCHLARLDKPLEVHFNGPLSSERETPPLPFHKPSDSLLPPSCLHEHRLPLCTPHSIFCGCEHVNIVDTLNTATTAKMCFQPLHLGAEKYCCSIYGGHDLQFLILKKNKKGGNSSSWISRKKVGFGTPWFIIRLHWYQL